MTNRYRRPVQLSNNNSTTLLIQSTSRSMCQKLSWWLYTMAGIQFIKRCQRLSPYTTSFSSFQPQGSPVFFQPSTTRAPLRKTISADSVNVNASSLTPLFSHRQIYPPAIKTMPPSITTRAASGPSGPAMWAWISGHPVATLSGKREKHPPEHHQQ